MSSNKFLIRQYHSRPGYREMTLRTKRQQSIGSKKRQVTMNLRTSLLILIMVTFTACVGGTIPVSQLNQSYVEPSLWTAETDSLAVIVTADDSHQAAKIVERVGGVVASDLWLIDAVSATVPADQLKSLAAQPGLVSVVADKEVRSAQEPDWDGTWATSLRFPVPYDGRPYAEATNDPKVWKLANPASVDVGADVLHSQHNITGQGVTVAVLDSGVYFSDDVKNALSPAVVAELFKGQADFVGDGICPGPGSQQSGYCFTDYDQSYDGYGHGSHVSGIIWNKYTDYDSGVYAGIAPGADILSVRVLGLDGTGTYADTIEGIQYVVAEKDTFNIRILNLSLSAYATTPYFEDPLNRDMF